jgi:hypothetical protein
MPRDLDEKPTVETIRELHDWNQGSYWSQQRALDAELKALTSEEHGVTVSDTADKKRKNRLDPERMTLGEGPRTKNVIYSLFSVPPTIGVMWTGEGQRNQAKGDEVEIGLSELWDQENPPTDSPWIRFVKQLLDIGRGAVLVLPGDAYWWDPPKKQPGEAETQWLARYRIWQRKAPVPILYRDLPAESTFPPSLGAVNDLALSTLSTTWHELQDIFSEKELAGALPEKREDRFSPVTLGIYANRKYVAYSVLADGKTGIPGYGEGRRFPDKILRSIEHKLDKCPIRILAGKTGPKEPGQYWRGILYDVRKMIPQLDRRTSEAATASRETVHPLLKAHLNLSGDSDDAASLIQKKLRGDIIDLNAGEPGGDGREDISAVHIPPFGRENIELAEMLRNAIRDLTAANEALTGGVQVASMPAWSLNQLTEQAKAANKELTLAIIAARIDHTEMLIRCVEAWGEPIVLQRHGEEGGSITLTPGELGSYEPILKGEYRLQTPVNQIAMIQTAISTMQAIAPGEPLPIALDWVMEEMLNIEQPWEMFKRSETTRFFLSPTMRKFREDIMLDEADVDVAADEGMSVEDALAALGDDPRLAGVADAIRQKAGGGLGPEARGAGRAQAPLSALPGGQQPNTVAP